MRVRFLKSVRSPQGEFMAGSTADLPDATASEYMKSGLAMQDKSIDPPSENKSEEMPSSLYRCSKCEMPHRYDSKIGGRHLKYKE